MPFDRGRCPCAGLLVVNLLTKIRKAGMVLFNTLAIRSSTLSSNFFYTTIRATTLRSDISTHDRERATYRVRGGNHTLRGQYADST